MNTLPSVALSLTSRRRSHTNTNRHRYANSYCYGEREIMFHLSLLNKNGKTFKYVVSFSMEPLFFWTVKRSLPTILCISPILSNIFMYDLIYYRSNLIVHGAVLVSACSCLCVCKVSGLQGAHIMIFLYMKSHLMKDTETIDVLLCGFPL